MSTASKSSALDAQNPLSTRMIHAHEDADGRCARAGQILRKKRGSVRLAREEPLRRRSERRTVTTAEPPVTSIAETRRHVTKA